MICLDTHALLWWAFDPERLSDPASAALARMEREGGCASAMSLWEIGIKLKRKKLELPIGIDEFTRRIERSGIVELVPVDANLWLRSLALPWDHSDPADRVIVATANARSVPLLTKDAAIQAFGGVTCVW